LGGAFRPVGYFGQVIHAMVGITCGGQSRSSAVKSGGFHVNISVIYVDLNQLLVWVPWKNPSLIQLVNGPSDNDQI
jgi:hypothetical protein